MKERSTSTTFVVAWLCSAAVVTALRFLNTTDLGYDPALQIQAGQNLLAGNGLSVYTHEGLDLGKPATLVTLTHFPAGFSLFVAALIAIGAGVEMAMKMMGAAGTLLGWWGWGKLSHSFFGEKLPGGLLSGSLGVLIAIVTPWRFTPSWAGTDIVLWAAVPWVSLWIMRAADAPAPEAKRLDWAAGAICGLCLLMRYASLFLVVYVACVTLWQSRLRIAVFMRRWAFFGLGLLPAFALQVYVNYVVSNVPATPGGLGSGERSADFLLRRAWEGVHLLGTANYPWVFWLPGRVANFFTHVDRTLHWRAGIVAAVFVAFIGWIRAHDLGPARAVRDPRVTATGLFLVLPLVLWGAMTLSSSGYLAEQRYYHPLVPLSILLAYAFIFGTNVTTHMVVNRVVRGSALVYLISYIAICLAAMPLVFLPGPRGAMQRIRLIGTDSFEHWPSMAIHYESSPARRFVRELLKEQPDAMLWTSKAQWFNADATLDRSRLFTLGCTPLSAQYLRGPARIIILTFDDEGPTEALWQWTGQGRHQRLDCFERLSDVQLLGRFPEESLKVLEARVPTGTEIPLRPWHPVQQK